MSFDSARWGTFGDAIHMEVTVTLVLDPSAQAIGGALGLQLLAFWNIRSL